MKTQKQRAKATRVAIGIIIVAIASAVVVERTVLNREMPAEIDVSLQGVCAVVEFSGLNPRLVLAKQLADFGPTAVKQLGLPQKCLSTLAHKSLHHRQYQIQGQWLVLELTAFGKCELKQITRLSASVRFLCGQGVDINLDVPSDLTFLPSIGPSRANAIVVDREKNGPFSTANDLTRINGLGPKTVKKIKPWLAQ